MKTRYIFFIIIALLHFAIFPRQSARLSDKYLFSQSEHDSTNIGGYGDMFYKRDFNNREATADLDRVVIFAGHSFGSISFFSELEMEHAKVENDNTDGEIAFEQAYLKFNINGGYAVNAGLFIPRIGLLNENHLPDQFNGNERNQVETYIIPATWRELGIRIEGPLGCNSLQFTAALLTGLNSANFVHGSGIREGRNEGKLAGANNLAITGSLRFQARGLQLQFSGYYGGTVPWNPHKADSLGLDSGFFGTPLALIEADALYESNGLKITALGTYCSLPNASEINRAYANNTPSSMYGFFVEAAFDLLALDGKNREEKLVAFLRYEKLDMNATVPDNGIIDGTLLQQHITSGISWHPITNIVVKTDVRFMHTGTDNPLLIINPSPVAPPYKRNNAFFTLGLGYSF